MNIVENVKLNCLHKSGEEKKSRIDAENTVLFFCRSELTSNNSYEWDVIFGITYFVSSAFKRECVVQLHVEQAAQGSK